MESMHKWLHTLQHIGRHDFSELCRTEAGSAILTDMIMQIGSLAAHSRRNSKFVIIEKTIYDTCIVVMRSYLGICEDEEFHTKLRSYNLGQERSPLQKVSDPYRISDQVLFNHTVKFSSHIVIGTQKLVDPPTHTQLRPGLPDHTPELYQKAIAQLTQSPKFQEDMPPLYAQNIHDTLVHDEANRKPSYTVRGLPPDA